MNEILKNKWVIIGGVVFGLVIITVVILWSRNTTKAQVALQEISKAQTFHTKAELTLKLPLLLRGKERPFNTLIMRTEGDMRHTEKIPEYAGSLYIEAKGRGNIFFADGEWRFLKDSTAFRLESLPVFINPSGSLIKKWTHVASTPLKTEKPDDLSKALHAVFGKLKQNGSDWIDGVSASRFVGSLSPQEEDQLAEILDAKNSGNQAFHILSRLLRSGNIQSLEVWVNKKNGEIPRLKVVFVRPLAENKTAELATLQVSFTDYGKQVKIDTPPKEVTVKPEVFSRIFGTGQIEAQP